MAENRKLTGRQRQGANRQMADTALKMELTLHRLTERHQGKPVRAVKALLRQAFRDAGWQISGDHLAQWAGMISRGEKIDVFFDPL